MMAHRDPVDVSAHCIGIIERVLDVDGVRTQDDLFSLGADSLRIAMILNEINADFNIDLLIESLYEFRVVQELIDEVTRLTERHECSPGPPAHPSIASPPPSPTPASPQERRMFAIWSGAPESTAYNINAGVRVGASFRADLAVDAINRILDARPILRSTFDTDADGVLKRYVGDREDAQVLSRRWDRGGAEDIDPEELTRPFDLRRGPLLRVHLVTAQDESGLLLFELHHIIGDGRSMALIAHDFMTCYNALATGEDPSLAESWDYGVYEEEWAASDEAGSSSSSGSYWAAVLDSPYRLCPPVGTDCSKNRGRSLFATVPRAKIQAVIDACKEGGGFQATTAGVLLTAYAVSLHRCYDTDSFIIGVPFSGRNDGRFDRTIGLFVNTLPIPIRLHDAPEGITAVGSVSQRLREAHQHESDQLDWIMRRRGDAGREDRSLFSAMFTMENVGIPPLVLEGAEARALPLHQSGLKVPLNLLVTEEEDFDVELYFDETQIPVADAAAVADMMRIVIDELEERPGARVDEYGGNDSTDHPVVDPGPAMSFLDDGYEAGDDDAS